MSRFVKTGLAVLVVVSILLPALPAFAQDDLQPELFVPTLRKDFGKVFERESYDHTFVIGNRGKADLVIENVKPG